MLPRVVERDLGPAFLRQCQAHLRIFQIHQIAIDILRQFDKVGLEPARGQLREHRETDSDHLQAFVTHYKKRPRHSSGENVKSKALSLEIQLLTYTIKN